jgi:hypothetical protein
MRPLDVSQYNQSEQLAYQSLALSSRLFRYGKISFHGGFLNSKTGRITALPARIERRGLDVRRRD